MFKSLPTSICCIISFSAVVLAVPPDPARQVSNSDNCSENPGTSQSSGSDRDVIGPDGRFYLEAARRSCYQRALSGLEMYSAVNALTVNGCKRAVAEHVTLTQRLIATPLPQHLEVL
jgi:hypothetical protein